METEHEGAGHGDVTLSLTTETPDGSHLHRSWTICECSLLLKRLDALLGEPEHETVATPEAFRASAEAALKRSGQRPHRAGIVRETVKLNGTARAALRDAGFTQSQWAAMWGYRGGKWGGDACGCFDDRCIGHHHFGENDCGCLTTLLDDAVAWREAACGPNQVELAAPFGLFRYVTVTTPGVMATVSATAGGFRPGSPAESVIRIEACEGWTAAVGEDNGQMVVRITKMPETPEPGRGGDPR